MARWVLVALAEALTLVDIIAGAELHESANPPSEVRLGPDTVRIMTSYLYTQHSFRTQQNLKLFYSSFPLLNLFQLALQYPNLAVNSHPCFLRPTTGKRPAACSIARQCKKQSMVFCQRRAGYKYT